MAEVLTGVHIFIQTLRKLQKSTDTIVNIRHMTCNYYIKAALNKNWNKFQYTQELRVINCGEHYTLEV